jgi:hypothetical protein
MKLTQKEQDLYDRIVEGMDEPGCGWLHELVEPSRSVSGVLGSLIRKGLVISTECPSESPEYSQPSYWVEIKI